MEGVFPEFAGRIVPFGYDWLGRHFALDLGRVKEGVPRVLMLEVGAGEAVQIPTSIEDFHNTDQSAGLTTCGAYGIVHLNEA